MKEIVIDQRYVSVNERVDHLQRHFSGARTVGSKFFHDVQQTVMERADAELRRKFQEARDNGQPAGRIALTLAFPDFIGSDALVALEDHEDKKHYRIVRDAGTSFEAVVTAIETDAIPLTRTATVIAGPDEDSPGDWGIYTMFPGAGAPSFPYETQPEHERTVSEAFWQHHGFLATRDEIAAHPQANM